MNVISHKWTEENPCWGSELMLPVTLGELANAKIPSTK